MSGARPAALLLVWLAGCVSIAELQTADLPRVEASLDAADEGPGGEDASAATDPGDSKAEDTEPPVDTVDGGETGDTEAQDTTLPIDVADAAEPEDMPAADTPSPADAADAPEPADIEPGDTAPPVDAADARDPEDAEPGDTTPPADTTDVPEPEDAEPEDTAPPADVVDAAETEDASAEDTGSEDTGSEVVGSEDTGSEDAGSEVVGSEDAAQPADVPDVTTTEDDGDGEETDTATDTTSPDNGPGDAEDTGNDANDECDPLLGCGQRVDGWTVFDSGAALDEESGLWWSRYFKQKTYDDLVAHCGSYGRGNVWRLPTVGEARSRIAGCPDTETGGACRISEQDCLSRACANEAGCGGCTSTEGPAEGCYQHGHAQACPEVFTSASCANCGGTKVFSAAYATGALNATPPTKPFGGYCVTGDRRED